MAPISCRRCRRSAPGAVFTSSDDNLCESCREFLDVRFEECRQRALERLSLEAHARYRTLLLEEQRPFRVADGYVTSARTEYQQMPDLPERQADAVRLLAKHNGIAPAGVLVDPDSFEDLVSSARRRLHPRRGGHPEEYRRVSEAAEIVRPLVGVVAVAD